MGGNISNLNDFKKQTVVLDIKRRWGKDIIEEGEIKIALLRGGTSMDQGW